MNVKQLKEYLADFPDTTEVSVLRKIDYSHSTSLEFVPLDLSENGNVLTDHNKSTLFIGVQQKARTGA